jgi:S-formylglutathione hydrolase FrmB
MKRLLLVAAAVACSTQKTEPASSPVAAPSPATPAATPAAAPIAKESAPVAKGRVETKKFKSAALGVDKHYLVYLPAGYDDKASTRYPVFYYLHGLGGNEKNWVDGGKLDAAADQLGLQAIVVMPDGDDSFYVDGLAKVDYDACMKDGTGLFIPQKQNKRETCVHARKYETYITKDLVGHIDATYRTIAKREARAIAGLSMGGFGALMLSMRHQDLFSAAASHSGVDSLIYMGPFPYKPGKVELMTDVKQWGGPFVEINRWMRGLFGDDVATWKQYDPTTLVDKLQPGRLALYLDCGTEDGFALHNGAAYLHDLLLGKKIDHAFFLGPGAHDFDFWRPRLPESLKFLRDHTAKPAT